MCDHSVVGFGADFGDADPDVDEQSAMLAGKPRPMVSGYRLTGRLFQPLIRR